jgi:hypothetical protein
MEVRGVSVQSRVDVHGRSWLIVLADNDPNGAATDVAPNTSARQGEVTFDQSNNGGVGHPISGRRRLDLGGLDGPF